MLQTILLRTLKWLLLLTLLAGIAISEPWRHLPPQWNPWVPLAIDHPMNLITKWKLSRLQNDPVQCIAALDSAPEGAIDYLALEDYTPVTGCPLSNVVRVRRTGIEYNASFTVTCPLAVAWLMFERQKLQPLADQHIHSGLQRVDHLGSFACRNIYHRDNARRSQHASANAFDVAGFRFADGTHVTVLKDWNNHAAPAKAAFLKDIHRSACGYFGTVLGPDYNQPHENHFHLDGSGFNFCR
ncbi:MAG: extensin family protein [Pseudomonas sp.]